MGTIANGPNTSAGRGKSPPVVQHKRHHPQDGNHAHSYCRGGLADIPQVLIWEGEIVIEKGL
jgi:hypothetical protein